MTSALSHYERLLPPATTLSAKEFRRALVALGLTYKEFASLIGVTDRTVREWANRIGTPAPVSILLHVLQAHYPPLRKADMRDAIATSVGHALARSGDMGKGFFAPAFPVPERESNPAPQVAGFLPPGLPKAVLLHAPFRAAAPDMEPQGEIPRLADFRRPSGGPLDARIRPPEILKIEQNAKKTT